MSRPPNEPPQPPRRSPGRDVGIGLALGVGFVFLTFWCITLSATFGQAQYSYSGDTLVVTQPSLLRQFAVMLARLTPLGALVALHVIAARSKRPQIITGFWILLGIGVLVFLVSCFALIAAFSSR